MNQHQSTINLGFTIDPYPAGTHMCLIYNDERERRQVIGKFIGMGVTSGEKVAYFADQATTLDMDQWLEDMGIEPPEDRAGELAIAPAEDTYCPGRKFDPAAMLATLESYHGQAMDEGYPACRVSGEMSWALRGIPGSERLMEYEARVNQVLETHPVTAICQYDAQRFDGATILECLEVHPYMIVRGQIVHNPYYMGPDQFLNKSLPR